MRWSAFASTTLLQCYYYLLCCCSAVDKPLPGLRFYLVLVPVWIGHFGRPCLRKSRFLLLLLFFFFWFQPHYLTKSTLNNARMHYLWISQILLFSHFFIKNGSHSTIHILKNYFATVFSVSIFSFNKNKLNPNGP